MSSKIITITTTIPVDNTSKISFTIAGGELPPGTYDAKITELRESKDKLEIISSVEVQDDCPFASILHATTVEE